MKSREKTRQLQENWSQQLEHEQVTKGTGPGFRNGVRSLQASHTQCKCSMETTRKSLKVDFKVMKLANNLNGKSQNAI